LTSGQLFVFSSPSGGGKSTIIAALRQDDPAIVFSISMTTRKPRKNEKHGIDYFFVDKACFREHIDAHDFLEWAEVHGEFYGTLRAQVDEQIKEKKKVILDIDVQGASQVKQNMPQAVRIFIMPPSMDVLRSRLKNRGTETPESLQKRLENAKMEIAKSDEFDFVVINQDLSTAIESVKEILNRE